MDVGAGETGTGLSGARYSGQRLGSPPCGERRKGRLEFSTCICTTMYLSMIYVDVSRHFDTMSLETSTLATIKYKSTLFAKEQ